MAFVCKLLCKLDSFITRECQKGSAQTMLQIYAAEIKVQKQLACMCNESLCFAIAEPLAKAPR